MPKKTDRLIELECPRCKGNGFIHRPAPEEATCEEEYDGYRCNKPVGHRGQHKHVGKDLTRWWTAVPVSTQERDEGER